MTQKMILYTDGAARGNPGPAAIGIVLVDECGNEIEALGETIGNATNNEAEYRALLYGLARALKHTNTIEIRTDSELLARQLNGAYRVRAANLKLLHAQAQRARKHFKRVTIAIVPRESNRRADALANQALDGKPMLENGNARSSVTHPPPLPLLIIITGAPCTGKTTLARRIAQELRLPLAAKDDIKESLFDSLGWKDREWSKQLGRATMRLLFYFVETQLAAGYSCIVESNFRAELATPEFRALQAKHNFVPLQIVLKCERDVLTQRFRTRGNSGTRHPGHVDHLPNDEELAKILTGEYQAMDIGGQVIKVDTTDFNRVNYADLVESIASVIEEAQSGFSDHLLHSANLTFTHAET